MSDLTDLITAVENLSDEVTTLTGTVDFRKSELDSAVTTTEGYRDQSESARNDAQSARDAAEGYRNESETFRNQARDAAEASGDVRFFDTFAEADAATLDEDQVVEVFEDETRGGARTRYRVESGELAFKLPLSDLIGQGAMDPYIYSSGYSSVSDTSPDAVGPHEVSWDSDHAVVMNIGQTYSRRVWPEQIIPVGAGYMLLYNSNRELGDVRDATQRTSIAFSDNLIEWKDSPYSPIITEREAWPWQGARAWGRHLVWDDANSRWALFLYSVEDDVPPGDERTGLATSPDLINWTIQEEPIVTIETGDIDQWGIPGLDRARVVSCVKLRGKWHAVVVARPQSGGPVRTGILVADELEGPWEGGPWNPVMPNIPAWMDDQVWFWNVVFHDGWWWAVTQGSSSASAGVARSRDFLEWEAVGDSPIIETEFTFFPGPLIPFRKSWIMLAGLGTAFAGRQHMIAFTSNGTRALLERDPPVIEIGGDFSGPHIILCGRRSEIHTKFEGNITGRRNWGGDNRMFRANVTFSQNNRDADLPVLFVDSVYSGGDMSLDLISCEYEEEDWVGILLDGPDIMQTYSVSGWSHRGREIFDFKVIEAGEATDVEPLQMPNTMRHQTWGRMIVGRPESVGNIRGAINAERVFSNGQELLPVSPGIISAESSVSTISADREEIDAGEDRVLLDLSGGPCAIYGGAINGGQGVISLVVDGVPKIGISGNLRAAGKTLNGDEEVFQTISVPAAYGAQSIKLELRNSSSSAREFGWRIHYKNP